MMMIKMMMIIIRIRNLKLIIKRINYNNSKMKMMIIRSKMMNNKMLRKIKVSYSNKIANKEIIMMVMIIKKINHNKIKKIISLKLNNSL